MVGNWHERGKIGQLGLGRLKHGVCEIVVLSWILCFSVRGGIFSCVCFPLLDKSSIFVLFLGHAVSMAPFS